MDVGGRRDGHLIAQSAQRGQRKRYTGEYLRASNISTGLLSPAFVMKKFGGPLRVAAVVYSARSRARFEIPVAVHCKSPNRKSDPMVAVAICFELFGCGSFVALKTSRVRLRISRNSWAFSKL